MQGEAQRDDKGQAHAAVWEHKGEGKAPKIHKEQFEFEFVEPSTRSYK